MSRAKRTVVGRRRTPWSGTRTRYVACLFTSLLIRYPKLGLLGSFVWYRPGSATAGFGRGFRDPMFPETNPATRRSRALGALRDGLNRGT